MKNLNNNLNFTSNPSYLGADRLWAGSDELIGREPKVEDYHGL